MKDKNSKRLHRYVILSVTKDLYSIIIEILHFVQNDIICRFLHFGLHFDICNLIFDITKQQ
jgi:hypothetical protein